MRILLFLSAGLMAFGDSHPAWWTFASPEATALVGIQWDVLQTSVVAKGIESALFDCSKTDSDCDSGLRFPDLNSLKRARQILISSPELLAIASGSFPAAELRQQAMQKGLKHSSYRGVEMWITPGKSTLSIAQISEQILLVARVKTLQSAIDRKLDETKMGYSPLLGRAAHYAQQDLWVVAARLPDPLADLFVPIDTEASGFEGSLSVRDGMHLRAVLLSNSAEETAAGMQKMIPNLPPLLKGLTIQTDRDQIGFNADISPQEVEAVLGSPRPVAIAQTKLAPETPAKHVIRIFGLDDGPREIPVSSKP